MKTLLKALIASFLTVKTATACNWQDNYHVKNSCDNPKFLISDSNKFSISYFKINNTDGWFKGKAIVDLEFETKGQTKHLLYPKLVKLSELVEIIAEDNIQVAYCDFEDKRMTLQDIANKFIVESGEVVNNKQVELDGFILHLIH